MDTIFAQSTAVGRAGVSVVRLSGPSAHQFAAEISGSIPPMRQVGLRDIGLPGQAPIDRALVVAFAGPDSFTGEDVVELHLHGSIAIVQAVLQMLGTFPGARLAEPGEFTRRALENDRLDLAQVEGLADLIESETEAQRKQALRVLSGELGAKVEGWRADLIRAAALIEATIDFADEDVPVDVSPEVEALMESVTQELATEIAGSKVAERIRVGFEVAIVGAPNAGKSTLLNAIAGRDAAIISSVAGTTRDVIEVRMDLGGLPVTILDTAGLRQSSDEIEAQGVALALKRARDSDLRIFLAEPEEELMLVPEEGDILVRPKGDLKDGVPGSVSGKTGVGVSELLQDVQDRLAARSAAVGLATHERHRMAMVAGSESLEAARGLVRLGPDHYDLAAAELRFGIRSLEALVGRIDAENLLDEIFASFCLGK